MENCLGNKLIRHKIIYHWSRIFLQIDEPKTPYTTGYSDSEEDSTSGTRPRRVSLIGPIDPDELKKGISAASSSKPKCYEPGSGPEDEDDESGLTEEQLGMASPFCIWVLISKLRT